MRFFRARKGLGQKRTPGMDRARRVLLGISVGYVGTGRETNRGRYFSNLSVFKAFFCSILRFFRERKGLGQKRTPGIDRARRVLLGISVGYIETGRETNRGKKNSNLLIRYPT